MTLLTFIIFAFIFTYQNTGETWAKYASLCSTILLGIIMFFYYRNKFRIYRTLKKIQNLEAYEKGGVVHQSWILEDRMIVCYRLQLTEISTTDIQKMLVDNLPHGKYKIILNGKYVLLCKDGHEVKRFAAYLQKRNPTIELVNVEPMGNGSLNELGA